MEENKTNVVEPTYDQLKETCSKLINDNRQLAYKLNELDNIFNIIPYYIEIIKSADVFDADFVQECKNNLRKYIIPNTNTKED